MSKLYEKALEAISFIACLFIVILDSFIEGLIKREVRKIGSNFILVGRAEGSFQTRINVKHIIRYEIQERKGKPTVMIETEEYKFYCGCSIEKLDRVMGKF